MALYHKKDNKRVKAGDHVWHRPTNSLVEVVDPDIPCDFRNGARLTGKYADPDVAEFVSTKGETFSLFNLDGLFHSSSDEEVFNGIPASDPA